MMSSGKRTKEAVVIGYGLAGKGFHSYLVRKAERDFRSSSAAGADAASTVLPLRLRGICAQSEDTRAKVRSDFLSSSSSEASSEFVGELFSPLLLLLPCFDVDVHVDVINCIMPLVYSSLDEVLADPKGINR